MSNDPLPNNSPVGETVCPIVSPNGEGVSVADLHREVERLRVQLAKVTAEAESYRRAAYSLLNKEVPYIPPTEEELFDLMQGPRGRSIRDIIDELEREGDG